jgi:hypothetical protein
VVNVAFNTGSGNPGAVGLRFDANNMGAVRNVSLVAPDGDGVVGLDYSYTDQEGPELAKWVYVRGFAVGVAMATSVDSETLEHVWVENYTVAAVRNAGQVVSMRALTAVQGSPTAVAVSVTSGEPNTAFLTLVDSTLTYTGAGSALVAINSTYAMMHVRNVATSGFTYSVLHVPFVPGPPPPPPNCSGSVVLNDTAGNGHQLAQYEGVASATACCFLCYAWNKAPSDGPCQLWTVSHAGGEGGGGGVASRHAGGCAVRGQRRQVRQHVLDPQLDRLVPTR